MASSRQEKEIRKRMRRIKDAKDDGRGREEISRRTKELYQYLEREGLVRTDYE